MTTLPVEIRQALEFAERARHEPAWYEREVLGADPYDKQVEMIESVRDNAQTSVVGANGVGKDWQIGRVVAWWQASRYPAKTIITGPSNRQVSDIVWREVRNAVREARTTLGGRLLPVESRWEFNDNHFALGFSTDKPFNITGFHSPNLLVVVTEAHGYADSYMTMIKRLLPNRLILTGNPFNMTGEFYQSHHDKRHLYNPITISAYDTPNVVEGRDVIPGAVTLEDIEQMANDWGEDSALFRASVHSEFAETEAGAFPLGWLEQAKRRIQYVDDAEKITAGLDVAGPGEDETSLALRKGPRILSVNGWVKEDPRGEVLAILRPLKESGALDRVNVDEIGIGYYLKKHLEDELGRDVVNGVNVADAPQGPNADRYANLKAQIYWTFRERLREGDVSGLVDSQAIGQLASVRYHHNTRGKVQIESKEDARKRGVKSPDRAEAIILTFAPPKRRIRAL